MQVDVTDTQRVFGDLLTLLMLEKLWWGPGVETGSIWVLVKPICKSWLDLKSCLRMVTGLTPEHSGRWLHRSGTEPYTYMGMVVSMVTSLDPSFWFRTTFTIFIFSLCFIIHLQSEAMASMYHVPIA